MDVPPVRPPLPAPNSARNIAILGAAIAVVGFAWFALARGELTGTLLGACCGLGGILLIAVAYLGQRALSPMPGAPVPPAVAAPGQPLAPPEAEYVCGKCGADLRPGATFCSKCGEPVED